MEHFLKLVQELMEVDTKITADMKYDALREWDSLLIISFIAMVDVEYNKTIRVVEFKKCHTFADLFAVIEKAQENG